MKESSATGTSTRRLRIRPVRDALIAGIVVFLVALMPSLTLYVQASNAYREDIHGRILDVARAAAMRVDGDRHWQLASSERNGSELHEHLARPLYGLLSTVPALRGASTMVMVDGQVHIGLDVASP
jgi:hypothetical protein